MVKMNKTVINNSITATKTWLNRAVYLMAAIPIIAVVYLLIDVDLSIRFTSTQERVDRAYALVHFGAKPNACLDITRKECLIMEADQIANEHGIAPRLFQALITQESAWRINAVSHAGAVGLTQLMPATALDHCGLDRAELRDPIKNMRCGASYFAEQLKRFGDVELALAAYNSGPDRVAKLGRVPRIQETQNYVRNITTAWGGL